MQFPYAVYFAFNQFIALRASKVNGFKYGIGTRIRTCSSWRVTFEREVIYRYVTGLPANSLKNCDSFFCLGIQSSRCANRSPRFSCRFARQIRENNRGAAHSVYSRTRVREVLKLKIAREAARLYLKYVHAYVYFAEIAGNIGTKNIRSEKFLSLYSRREKK